MAQVVPPQVRSSGDAACAVEHAASLCPVNGPAVLVREDQRAGLGTGVGVHVVAEPLNH